MRRTGHTDEQSIEVFEASRARRRTREACPAAHLCVRDRIRNKQCAAHFSHGCPLFRRHHSPFELRGELPTRQCLNRFSIKEV